MDPKEYAVSGLTDPVFPTVGTMMSSEGIPNPVTRRTGRQPEDWMLYVPSVGYVPRPTLPLLYPQEDLEKRLSR